MPAPAVAGAAASAALTAKCTCRREATTLRRAEGIAAEPAPAPPARALREAGLGREEEEARPATLRTTAIEAQLATEDIL
mmetsp:Transcript_1448/g.2229  ORF Transcript_1448/g.2229 Transcript_1448/m.2229 type:complete len:80 (+) Transcript_1448:507-746(+)